MSDDELPKQILCCPDAERIPGLKTVYGTAVIDVHKHRGLLRGFICEENKNRLMHWYPNGRLSLRVEGDHDLRRTV